jgi:acyl-CoA dehydrogenase
MSYRAPVADILFSLHHSAGLREEITRGLFGSLEENDIAAILGEAGRFASDEIAPLNRIGDMEGARLIDGRVRMPHGWREVYRRWTEAGWVGLTGPQDYDGQNLPTTISVAVQEMWNAASMAFGIGPVLTVAAVDALHRFGTDDLKSRYLPRLVSGEWAGTMCLTEPQAGSDLGLLASRAEPRGDGSYLIRGTKIFVTYGEHDLTSNIVHMVLARLPDAPHGHRGISMFLVPKFLVREDGTPGKRNDIECIGVEHKLGIHASPTCTMSFGAKDGAVGWLVGEHHKGLACMFTMMNHARLMVGVQGVAIAERAYQQALAYARERRQGRRPGMAQGETVAIVEHPDIRRSLMTMRAMIQAARAICHATARALDVAKLAPDPAARAAAQARADLLTPVAKAFSTDIGVEVASLGLQVHGGTGYIEETGAAQHLRDARIAPIYEGTNGIQAIDLVTRKLPLSDGQAVRALIAELRGVGDVSEAAFGRMGECLTESVDALERATGWLLDTLPERPDAALAGATPYLRLFAIAAGGCGLARGALAALNDGDEPANDQRIATARFFAENASAQAGGLCQSVVAGAETILADDSLARD